MAERSGGRGSLYGLVLLVALLIFSIITAPAWLMGRLVAVLSHDQVLEQAEGSFWSGKAAAVNFVLPDGSRYRPQNFAWRILPGQLLRGNIAARVSVADAQLKAQGIVAVSGRETVVSELQADLPATVASNFAPLLALWQPGGNLHLSAGNLAIKPLQLNTPATLNWTGASLSLSKLAPLGDYQLSITPNGAKLDLKLQTSSGALLLSGTGQYAMTSGGEIRVAASSAPGFEEQLAPLLQIMGPSDGNGSVNVVTKLPPLAATVSSPAR